MHNQKAMLEAHRNGMRAAGDNVTREAANAAAHKLPIEEGDAYLAGYYAELRRLSHYKPLGHYKPYEVAPPTKPELRQAITRTKIPGFDVTYTILTGTPDDPMPTRVSKTWAEHRVAQGHARYVDGYGMPAPDAVPLPKAGDPGPELLADLFTTSENRKAVPALPISYQVIPKPRRKRRKPCANCGEAYRIKDHVIDSQGGCSTETWQQWQCQVCSSWNDKETVNDAER